MTIAHSNHDAPSAWLLRWAHLITPGGSALDVAAGGGRHTRWLSARGHAVTAVDRDAAAMAALRPVADAIVADIEAGPWPLPGRRFDAVVVTNYLWRPILAEIVGSVAPGGVLVWETFAIGNETVGRPSNPQFLLQPGELLGAVAGLRIVAYEDGFIDAPQRFVQRIVAVRDAAVEPGLPVRHPLAGSAAWPGR